MKRSGEKIPEEQCSECRRKFLQLSGGVVFGSLVMRNAESAERDETVYMPLAENDRIDIGDTGDKLVRLAYDLRYTYEKNITAVRDARLRRCRMP